MFALACLPSLWAQGSSVLTVAPSSKITARRGGTVAAKTLVQLRNGYHVNSNTPNDEYLIPLKLTWGSGPLEAGEVVYPKPEMQKFEFSEKPISVFTGDFSIATRFRVPATASRGPGVLTGRLRYQACDHKSCLPPRTVPVNLPFEIE